METEKLKLPPKIYEVTEHSSERGKVYRVAGPGYSKWFFDETEANCDALTRDVVYEAGRQSAAPQWVSVGERLPEEDSRYLVMWNRNVTVMYFLCGGWNHSGNRYELDAVTHWMPLPAPPTPETSDAISD